MEVDSEVARGRNGNTVSPFSADPAPEGEAMAATAMI
jgi:hypothetical protein